MKTLSLLLTVSIGLTPLANAANDMIGVRFNGDVYYLDSSSGTSTFIGSSGAAALNSMAIGPTGTIYAGSMLGDLYEIDEGSATATWIANIGGDIRALAINSSNELYAAFNNIGSIDQLYRIDLNTFASTLVGATGLSGLQAMAFDSNDTLYGFEVGLQGTGASGLNTISTTTGAATDVNPGVGSAPSIQYLSFSSSGALFGGSSDHYSIDPTSGTWSLINTGGYSDIRGADFTGPSAGCKAQWTLYGSGVNGTNSKPTLSLTNDPVLGTSTKLVATSSSNNNESAALFFGLAPSSLPAPWGGPLLVDPLLSVTAGMPPSGLVLILAIPNDPALCGLQTFFQVVQSDSGAPLGISSSRGLAMNIGL